MDLNGGSTEAHLRVFAGVDGCRGGWFAAWTADGWAGPEGGDGSKAVDGGRWRIGVFAHFASLMETVLGSAPPQALQLLVDIPIGLPFDDAPRRCDVEARRLLGPRRGASVFPAPPRAVLRAGSWEEGLSLARAASGRGISLQAWHLVPKIREVDAFLRADPSWMGRIREAHPELIFRWLTASGVAEEGLHSPDLPSKRTPSGFETRLALLEAASPGIGGVVEEALQAHPRRVLARDDILDALAVAVASKLGGNVGLQAVPDPPERDGEGLPMEIVIGARSLSLEPPRQSTD